jgi:hypothetical protein
MSTNSFKPLSTFFHTTLTAFVNILCKVASLIMANTSFTNQRANSLFEFLRMDYVINKYKYIYTGRFWAMHYIYRVIVSNALTRSDIWGLNWGEYARWRVKCIVNVPQFITAQSPLDRMVELKECSSPLYVSISALSFIRIAFIAELWRWRSRGRDNEIDRRPTRAFPSWTVQHR